MKIVKINGGLGNQMFQYAFACKLRHLFPNEKLLIDIKSFQGNTERNYELNYVFNVDIPVATAMDICHFTLPFSSNSKWGSRIHSRLGKFFNRNIYVENKINYFKFYQEPLNIKSSCYYDGVWFNEGYFGDIKEKIKEVFTFKRPLNSFYKNIKKSIEESNSVSIHVRRGDYLLYDAYKGICDREYFEKAIIYIKENIENPHFFIFSNDILWCKNNLEPLMDSYTFVDNNDPQNNYLDMQFMSYCKHNIISHSSFSWWAAWLNNNSNKKVIAPYLWVNSKIIKNKPQLKNWILISQNS